MRPVEEAGRPYAAIGMDEALAGLDDQPVATGVRTSGQRVECAKELGGKCTVVVGTKKAPPWLEQDIFAAASLSNAHG